jgi:hypothetical protein
MPSAAVLAWARNALDNLDLVSGGSVDLPFQVPPESLETAFGYVLDWVRTAEAGDTFRWSAQVDPDVALNLLRYWHNLARAMLELAEEGEIPLVSPEAEVFAGHLLQTLLALLSAEGKLDPETAERMWINWPRVGRGRGLDGF